MRKPVTSDVGVLQGWPKTKKPVTSLEVAEALGITVFQITARLKGMEGRGLVERDTKGLWKPTGKEAAPEIARQPRARIANGSAVGLPDDSKVPRISRPAMAPPDNVVRDAERRLEELKQRIREYEKDKKRFRRELMTLNTERDGCLEIIKRANAKGVWRTRFIREPKIVSYKNDKDEPVHVSASQIKATTMIDPKGHEYIEAGKFETAHLIVEGGLRLRLYETSGVAKREEKLKQEQEERERAKQEQRNQRILEESNEKEARRDVRTVRGKSGKGKAKPATKAATKAKVQDKGKGKRNDRATAPATHGGKGTGRAAKPVSGRKKEARPQQRASGRPNAHRAGGTKGKGRSR